MATILLAGCGKLGEALGILLQQQGHRVYGLRRSNVQMAFATLQANLVDPESITLPDTIDYVVYTATPSQRSDDGYKQVYVDGIANLLRALKNHKVKHFFFVSSTAVYHQNDGSWVDESSPTQPQRFNGQRVLEGEQLVAASSIPATAIRFGAIYGPKRSWLIRRVQAGAEIQTTPAKFTNRIHEDDCVCVLAFLIEQREQGKSLAPFYIAVDDDPASEESVCQWLASTLNAPTPRENNLADNPMQNKRCRNALLKQLGYRFLYPNFREGYAPICANLKTSP